ncbi:aldose epimerase family protein [Bacillus alkalicellulosilyticus]|uniref:aldose epimerase family protein n=1 Tax=Alkalihalobacterium alkalicellulosilyticum TaxID=1912214 RepID=UPI000997D112|nr:aldose epimerase family protein [Bacillus alkalicellulosilyticus]
MKVSKSIFGEFNGQPVDAYTISNSNNMTFTCISYGCIITSILTPDRNGNVEEVTLGFDDLPNYINNSPYFGSIVGRIAGRIGGAQFELDGKTYTLAKNDGENHLHGGIHSFSHVVWNASVIENEKEAGVEFTYTSPDGEEGFPGTVELSVKYILNNENEITMSYNGVTDQKTLLNMTNHTYFNLSGNIKTDVSSHKLTMKSNKFIELQENLIPTGEFLEVEGTPFDFRNGRLLGEGFTSPHIQNIRASKGYDHPFMLSENHNEEIILEDEKSGRALLVETDEPCVVVYTSNMLGGEFDIRGTKAQPYLAVCLETQGAPDSIHHPQFGSSILDKGESYSRTTTFRFFVKE